VTQYRISSIAILSVKTKSAPIHRERVQFFSSLLHHGAELVAIYDHAAFIPIIANLAGDHLYGLQLAAAHAPLAEYVLDHFDLQALLDEKMFIYYPQLFWKTIIKC